MCRDRSAADTHCDQAPSHAIGLDVVIQAFGDLDEALDSQVLELALLLSIAGLVLQKLQQGSNDSLPVRAGYQQAWFYASKRERETKLGPLGVQDIRLWS